MLTSCVNISSNIKNFDVCGPTPCFVEYLHPCVQILKLTSFGGFNKFLIITVISIRNWFSIGRSIYP